MDILKSTGPGFSKNTIFRLVNQPLFFGFFRFFRLFFGVPLNGVAYVFEKLFKTGENFFLDFKKRVPALSNFFGFGPLFFGFFSFEKTVFDHFLKPLFFGFFRVFTVLVIVIFCITLVVTFWSFWSFWSFLAGTGQKVAKKGPFLAIFGGPEIRKTRDFHVFGQNLDFCQNGTFWDPGFGPLFWGFAWFW